MHNRSEGTWRRAVGLSRTGARLGFAVAALAAILLVAACSAGPAPSNGVARLDTPDPTAAAASGSPAPSEDVYQRLLAYSQCMRQHGVPKFPDPISNGSGGGGLRVAAGPGTGLDPNSASFQAAQQACQSLMPAAKTGTGGTIDPQQFQAMLAYSQCMRSHGLPDFPDPQQAPGGGVTMQLKGGPGSALDPNSPTFQAAQQACQALVPGAKFGISTSGGPTGPGGSSGPGGASTGGQP